MSLEINYDKPKYLATRRDGEGVSDLQVDGYVLRTFTNTWGGGGHNNI